MYEVRWKRLARNQLAELWLGTGDRDAITEAVAEVDRLLAARPHTAGESRPDSRRIVFARPLVALYQIVEDDRRVEVLAVWSVERPASPGG